MSNTKEPEAFRRGKAFQKEVQCRWEQDAEGKVALERSVDLEGEWKPSTRVIPPSTTKRRGRVDVYVKIDEPSDNQRSAEVAVLEIKSTNFDGMERRNIRRNIARHRKQIIGYIGSQLDLDSPTLSRCPEKVVVPGVIYPHKPSDPGIRNLIEGFFAEECISVIWQDEEKGLRVAK